MVSELLFVRESLLDRQARRAEQAEDITALVVLPEAMDDAEYLALAYMRQAGYLSATRQPAQSHESPKRRCRSIAELETGRGKPRRSRIALPLFGLPITMAWRWNTDAPRSSYTANWVIWQAKPRLYTIWPRSTRASDSPRQALAHFQQALDLHWARQDHRRQGLTLYGIAHTLRQTGDRRQR